MITREGIEQIREQAEAQGDWAFVISADEHLWEMDARGVDSLTVAELRDAGWYR